MHIGIYWGYIAMIEGLVARMKAEIGRPVKVVATGGPASVIIPYCREIDEFDPDLTLKGLLALYEMNA